MYPIFIRHNGRTNLTVCTLNARSIANKSAFRGKGKHLSSVLVSNGYSFSFNSAEPANEFKATAVLPYVKGLSEQLRRCLQQQGVRAVFKSETTLRSQLVRPKDAVDPAKQDGVVYRIPCECGKVVFRKL